MRPLAWEPPPAEPFDALLLTSANTARHAGPALERYKAMPCYCVGEATAAAATEAGLTDLRVGTSDGAAAVAMAAAEGVGAMLHLAGAEHVLLDHPGLRIARRIVYSSDPLGLSGDARAALASGALVLLHSARAAAHFAALVDLAGLSRRDTVLAAISAPAAGAAGPGWEATHVAPEPRDAALLALAAQLCKTGGGDRLGTGE